MLTEIIEETNTRGFAQFEDKNGYRSLQEILSILDGYVNLMTLRGQYFGTQEALLQRAQLGEYLAGRAKRAA